MPRPITAYVLDTSWSTVNVTMKCFLLYWEVMGQGDQSAFLGITVQGNKFKKSFDSKN